MSFIADLHIHSCYSRATSKSLFIPNLAAWAALKGINVLGTGDFTHPKWLEHLQENLIENQSGLLELKNKITWPLELSYLDKIPEVKIPKFMLSTEISCIYKKYGKVRKQHCLVYVPNFETAILLNKKLAAIGNLNSDGRPILGLDVSILLEIVRSVSPQAYLIPAHIWTPWFSLFGSKSGFNSVHECFGDMTSEIFALETGLSSDPSMNWLCSDLDKYTLVSNSDAHSGANLGREANVFKGEMSYEGIFSALHNKKTTTDFEGTIEFFPEEGKYFLDGHRACGVCFTPEETIANKNVCPICKNQITVGVLNRVRELADRKVPLRPINAPSYASLIPLREIISEIIGLGINSKKVFAKYVEILQKLGTELSILGNLNISDIKTAFEPLGIAVERMRKGKINKKSGFDGEYGAIKLFDAEELKDLKAGRFVKFIAPSKDRKNIAQKIKSIDSKISKDAFCANQEQELAIKEKGPLLVIAGVGTGKTRVIIERARTLLTEGVNADKILILASSPQGVFEIKTMLDTFKLTKMPIIDTLPNLSFDYWEKCFGKPVAFLSDINAQQTFKKSNSQNSPTKIQQEWLDCQEKRQNLANIESDYFFAYIAEKDAWNLVDYMDVLEFWLEEQRSGKSSQFFEHILIDDGQDFSPLELELVAKLTLDTGFGILFVADCLQRISGLNFDLEARLKSLWDNLKVLNLTVNYRCNSAIMDLGESLLPSKIKLETQKNETNNTQLFIADDAKQEAQWVVNRILALQINSTQLDIAILVRLEVMIPPLTEMIRLAMSSQEVMNIGNFYNDERVNLILQEGWRFLGADVGNEPLAIPPSILLKGPLFIKAYLEKMQPFDDEFWQSNCFKEFCLAFEKYGSWLNLLNAVSLGKTQKYVKKETAIKIMTIEAAKGLEFDAVFIVGLDEGLLPFAGFAMLQGRFIPTSMPHRDQERNLLYVALTRARKYLFLSTAKNRFILNRQIKFRPSTFLDELALDEIKKKSLAESIQFQEKQLYFI